MSKANVLAYRDRSASYYNSFGNYASYGIYPLDAMWLYSGFLGGYTFLPFNGYTSFYGYSFVPLSGFGFGFLPAVNRPFGNATANTYANQGPRPTSVGAGSNAALHGGSGGGFGPNSGHAPIHAGGTSGMPNPGATMHAGNVGGGMTGSAPSSGGAVARPAPAAASAGGRRP